MWGILVWGFHSDIQIPFQCSYDQSPGWHYLALVPSELHVTVPGLGYEHCDTLWEWEVPIHPAKHERLHGGDSREGWEQGKGK